MRSIVFAKFLITKGFSQLNKDANGIIAALYVETRYEEETNGKGVDRGMDHS